MEQYTTAERRACTSFEFEFESALRKKKKKKEETKKAGEKSAVFERGTAR